MFDNSTRDWCEFYYHVYILKNRLCKTKKKDFKKFNLWWKPSSQKAKQNNLFPSLFWVGMLVCWIMRMPMFVMFSCWCPVTYFVQLIVSPCFPLPSPIPSQAEAAFFYGLSTFFGRAGLEAPPNVGFIFNLSPLAC